MDQEFEQLKEVLFAHVNAALTNSLICWFYWKRQDYFLLIAGKKGRYKKNNKDTKSVLLHRLLLLRLATQLLIALGGDSGDILRFYY